MQYIIERGEKGNGKRLKRVSAVLLLDPIGIAMNLNFQERHRFTLRFAALLNA